MTGEMAAGWRWSHHSRIVSDVVFFAAASVALLICSSVIDYSRKLPV